MSIVIFAILMASIALKCALLSCGVVMLIGTNQETERKEEE